MAQETKRRLRRRWIVLAIILVVIAALVLPPLVNLNRYGRDIAQSISSSIGRPVTMSAVSLQLLPLPALSLSNFVIGEQPGFGAEPMLQAGSVTAYPRFSSLWRGRLEISSIHFDNASLNLVREPDGSWNFASALVRAAETPQAPTGQTHPGKVLRFPYIEVSHSRINFKSGIEKKPFSFVDTDASVWLESSGRWGVHFRAHPVRTDLELDPGDAGTLRIDGSMRRAAVLDKMPLDLSVAWSNAQLGQFSRTLLGRDAGWRGSFNLRGQIRGTAGLARLKASLNVDRLHRVEFMPDQPLTLNANCEAVYRKEHATIDNISCISNAGGGIAHLTGAVTGIDTHPRPNVALSIKDLPASFLLQGLKELRNDVDGGVRADGKLQGNIAYVSSPAPQLTGTLSMDSLKISTPGDQNFFAAGPITLLCENGGNSTPRSSMALLLEPVELAMGRKTSLTLDGRFTTSGFDLHLSGEGSLARLRRLDTVLAWSGAGSARSSRAALGLQGAAALDVNLNGPWVLPFSAPGEPAVPFTAMGSVTITDANMATSYLPQPIAIVSAQALLGPTTTTWTNASIEYGGIRATGTLEYPALCVPGQKCAAHFHLKAKSVDLGKLQTALRSPADKEDLLRRILSRIDSHPETWPELSGSISIGALSAANLTAHGITGAIGISDHSLNIQSLNGRLLGGVMHLAGSADFSDKPRYAFTAQIEGASPRALAELFHENWGDGRLNITADWKMAGWNANQLSGSANGKLHWDWNRKGMANRASLNPSHALAFNDWSGNATFGNRSFKVVESRLDREEGTVPLQGTISFDRSLNLINISGKHSLAITGTLEKPKVTSTVAESTAAKR